MTTLTDEQLADLKQKAMECSKWFSADKWGQFTVIYVAGRNVSLRDYLEAATPQTILALLQRIGELEAELATLRRDGHAPPGKLLVDAETLGELIWCAAGGKHCAGEMCKAYKHCDQKMVAAYPEQTCRDAWLAHFGLAEPDENDLRDAH